MISGSGWAWASVRAGNSLSYRRGRGQGEDLVVVLLLDGIYGSKVIILEEDTDVVEVGVGVWEIDKRGDEGDKRVDRWVVRGVFRAVVRGMSLSKLGKSEWLVFWGAIPSPPVSFNFL